MILAQTAEFNSSLIQYGAIGAMLGASVWALTVLYRQIKSNAEADRKARDIAEERLRQSHADMIDKVMPVLQNVNVALVAAVEAMRDTRRGSP